MVSTRSSSLALTPGPKSSPSDASPPPIPPPSTRRRGPARSTATTSSSQWTHQPSTLVVAWLFVSLPLVLWDAAYVFLRPHSMPGGSLHWPVWSLYAIQAELDYTYGFKAWNAGDGWNGAQSAMNLVETAVYLAYLGLWWGSKGPVGGRKGAVMALLGFVGAVGTVDKTLLYWLNEAFSGFANIGHNPPARLFFLWVIPNGAWIVFPSIMAWQFGADILQGLERASAPAGRSKAE
ncbi:hypothetical protein OQA88_975 [Cercophora sp. LCS_1]